MKPLLVVCTVIVLFPFILLAQDNSKSKSEKPDDSPTLTIVTKVVDVHGKPVEGAIVELESGEDSDEDVAKFDGVAELVTGSLGEIRFEDLKCKKTYQVLVRKKDAGFTTSRWTHRLDKGTVELPTLVLPGYRNVTGRIIDAAGEPIKGARVFQRGDAPVPTECESDENGNFELKFPETRGLIFFDAKDYWFTGKTVIEPAGDPKLVVTLHSRNKDNPEQYDIDWGPKPTADDYALAGKFIEETVEQALQELSTIGPMEELDELAKRQRGFVERQISILDRDAGREIAAESKELSFWQHLYDIDGRYPDLMVAWANSSDDLQERISGLSIINTNLRLGEVKTDDIAQLREDLKHQAIRILPEARRTADVSESIALKAYLIEIIHDSGDSVTTKALMNECVEQLNDLEGEARENAQWSLCEAYAKQGNVERSIEMVDGLKPMFPKLVCTEIVKHDPQAAWELVKDVKFEHTGGSGISATHVLPKLCYWAAKFDTDLALKFAEKVDDGSVRGTPYPKPSQLEEMDQETAGWFRGHPKEDSPTKHRMLKAKIYGMIAGRIAEREPERARKLMERAIAMYLPMRKLVKNPSGGWVYSPSMYLASIVPDAARIDPGLAAEVSWRALSIRAPIMRGNFVLDYSQRNVINIHLQLDPECAVIIERYFVPFQLRSYAGSGSNAASTNGLPWQRQFELCRSMSTRTNGPSHISPRNQHCCQLAMILTSLIENERLGPRPEDCVRSLHAAMWIHVEKEGE